MEEVDAVVVGAGVVGLAVARALALAGREVLVLERADAIGTETSSRNSEVIHAGIYYPNGSLKAETCVAGRHQLYDYCRSRGVPHRRCGKLIVATGDDQRDGLERLHRTALGNGVEGLEMLGANAVQALEPALNGVAAMYSPETGIIDSHGLMLAYQGEAEDHGAMIAFHAPMERGEVLPDGRIRLDIPGEEMPPLACRTLVNAAGLHAPALGAAIDGLPPETVPTAYYARGHYFTLTGRAPFRHLIYPAPEAAGLGIHLTLDLAGQARFGPDVEWIEEVAYDVDPARGERFYAAIRTYWPDLPDGALQPGYAGIRPKLQAPGEPAKDFVIQGPEEHGVAGLINLYGIESPGLTASLALADKVVALAKD